MARGFACAGISHDLGKAAIVTRDAPTPKTKALIDAMAEARRMRREGVSEDDINRGFVELLRDLIPPKASRYDVCDLCGETGYQTVQYDHPAFGRVDAKGYCLCSTGRRLWSGHQAQGDEKTERDAKKRAANW